MLGKLKFWLRKRKYFKAYRGPFRVYLKEKYGRTRNLKYKQIQFALVDLGLTGEFDCYAYAMSLSKSGYKFHQKKQDIMYSQDVLQFEMGVNKALLEVKFPSTLY